MACLLLVGLFVLTFALLSSCKKAEGSVPVGESELPDMELRNADYTVGDDFAGISPDDPMYLHAALITIYSTERDTVLTEVSFSQGGNMSGKCRNASVSSDNGKAILSGDVVVKIDNDGTLFTIESQEVEWDVEQNILLCTGEVTVTYGDGTKIHAEGFSADINENKYEFGKILEGKLE